MKKKITVRTAMILIICIFMTIPAIAAESDMSFSFDLTANGKDTVEVQPGDIITLTLKLRRTDEEAPFVMYAMQDEICYDGTFLKLVNGSEMLGQGINSTDISKSDRYREYYMNYLSMSGGAQWNDETLIGSIQLQVIGQSGVTTITNQDYLVSLQDGSGSYPCQANEVTVIVSTECTVSFVSNGGSQVPDQMVWYGEKVERPEDPEREGYAFAGWFTDIHLSDEWDFENDTVQGNMTLYAKWEEVPEGSEPDEEQPVYGWWILPLPVLIIIFLLMRKHSTNQK